MVPFTHLHVHDSLGSMSDGLATVDQLFNRAKELEMGSLALTDHGSLAEVRDGRKASLKTGVKYVVGIEAYFQHDNANDEEKRKHLILLARNATGYKNLLALNYEGFKQAKYVAILNKVFPRIDWKLLEQYNDGLICLTACSNGPVSKALFSEQVEGQSTPIDLAEQTIMRLKTLFDKNLYLEVQPHKLRLLSTDRKTGQVNTKDDKPIIVSDQKVLNDFLVSASKRLGVKLVATCDVHYLAKEDAKYHDMLMAINDKKPLNDPTRHRYGVEEFYLKPGQEVFDFFAADYSEKVAKEVCTNTLEIANKCEEPTYLDPTGPRFPRFNVREDKDYTDFNAWNTTLSNVPEDHLFMRFKVLQAFKKLKLNPTQRQIYKERIQQEINVLEQHNFCSYMLIVSDFIKRGREHGVHFGPGRGSVAGSLVAYLLRIHDVNPIEYDLLFERFHNKEKKAFPDIDTDIDPVGRDWVEQYLISKYGAQNVAHVSNLSTMTPKVVIKDLARSLELGGSKSEAFKIAGRITDTIPGDAHTIDEALEASKEFREACVKYPQLEEYGRKLCGLEKTYATHAAGIVIGDVDLSTFVPLRIDKNGAVAVQYEKNRCEEMGLIKMDLLAIEHLSIIANILKNTEVLGQKCPEPKDIPLDDPAVWADIARGHTLGVFQMGSPHMIELCKKIKPRCIKDLSLVNALGRPSAAKSRDVYVARRDGRVTIEYKHECLRPALESTLGVGVYEEQLMKLANTVAGWNLSKADGLRKLTKYKNKDPKFAEKLKLDFITDACNVSKLTVNQAEEVWTEVVEVFALYGFNQSHSIAYSINGYHTAYYKHYYPAAFMCALLKSEVDGNGQDRDTNIRTYKREAKRLSLSIIAPDINRSGESYDLIDAHTLITGLTAIKGVGETAVKAIFEARDKHKFKSFPDFLYRTNSSKVRKDSIQALAKAGAFDCLGLTRKSAFTYYQDIRQRVNKYGDQKAEQGIDEIYCASGFEFNRPDFVDEWSRPEFLQAENEVLGEFVSGGINEVYNNFFTQNGVLFNRVKNIPDKTQIRIEAVVSDIKIEKFKAGKNRGKLYARCSITDINGDPITLTIWNENWIKYKRKLIIGKPFKAITAVNEWGGSKNLILIDITE